MNETAPQDDASPPPPMETFPVLPEKNVSVLRVIGEILLGGALLCGFCTVLPSRVKLFFLFPLLVGAAVGALVAWRSSATRFRPGWFLPPILGLLVWGGQLGLQYREYVRHWEQSFAKDPAAEWDKEWRQKASDPASVSDPALKPYREYLQSVDKSRAHLLSLSGFLEFRIRPLGLTRFPWLVMALEAVLCGIAAVVSMRAYLNWFPIRGRIN